MANDRIRAEITNGVGGLTEITRSDQGDKKCLDTMPQGVVPSDYTLATYTHVNCQLATIVYTGSPTRGTVTLTYTYDADGVLTNKAIT